jgi:amino acid transporter
MSQMRIPVWVAILINANIVIGSAFFLSAGKISATNGILAPFAWVLCGLMLLPLVIVLARLSMHYPLSGGLYIYSKKCLGSTWGFISGWGYFIGTAAANAAVIHAFSKQVQKMDVIESTLQTVHLAGIRLDVVLVLVFTIFNLLNVEFLERTQVIFAILKGIPLLIVLISLPFLFDINNFASVRLNWSGFFETLPLVLFAYIGMEACCAVADKIENGHKNAARVILVSFSMIMIIYTILQLALLCIHGGKNVDAFLTIMPMLTSNQTAITWGNALIYIGLLSSFLAGFYGMFYYNNWNLYAMGKERSVIFSKYLTKVNKNDTPWVCVFVQSIIVMSFLLLIGKNYYRITIGDLATTIAYLLSVISYLVLYRSWVGILALLSCVVLAGICANNLWRTGSYVVIPFFVAILLLGFVAYRFGDYINKRTI